ncbi:hypothetical protein [Thioalkalivibrio denitrificans]|uniref:hypothetical protein n=1 Tax=Thioalkalivibrio denitrificans TaxID=108003 RepID=UPI0011157365|nr:hypothetical protein [Thioalkalivibrio denitrificans]
MKRTTLCSAGVLCLGLLPHVVHGSAWTRPQGSFLILAPVSYTVADEAFDDSGNRVDRLRFEMVEFSPLIEYGMTDSITVGMQPKYRQVSVETANGTVTNSGLAESDFLVRKRLWSRDQASFSVQGLVKVPINPDEDHEAALGRDQMDAEVKLAYGNRRPAGAGRIFYSGEAGFRKRFEGLDDELSLNAFFGWSPGGAWSFIARSANTFGLGSDDNNDDVLTAGPSYTRHDAQLMTSYRMGNSASLVAGVSHTYAGENVGAGNTGFLALTMPF